MNYILHFQPEKISFLLNDHGEIEIEITHFILNDAI